MPIVSIVLPTYNGADFIKESIESVISQTFLDWELIIVNDCSTDGTLEIVNEYASVDNRIKIVNNLTNKRLPKSLNIGFSYARGQYLTWTSDDNMYHEDAIEKMVSYLDEHDKDMMVCAKMNIISECGEFQYVTESYDNHELLKRNCVGACFLYRANVLFDIGEYNPDFFLVEDYDYWLRIYLTYGGIAYIDEILYDYRNHGKSLSMTKLNEVRQSKVRLQIRYLDNILISLMNEKEYLCRLFIEIREASLMSESIRNKLIAQVEVLSMIEDGDYPEKVIVYGAGKMGYSFWEKYAKKIVFFSDCDESKQGHLVGTKEIVTLSQMADYSKQYAIVVAAGKLNVYSFLLTLKELGVQKCFVYSEL